jgi:hypothetical protein
MNKTLSAKQIHARFKSEWVLVADPQTTEFQEVTRGKVLYHSKDRDAVYRKALELRPTSSAILYTGKIPEGTVIVL